MRKNIAAFMLMLVVLLAGCAQKITIEDPGWKWMDDQNAGLRYVVPAMREMSISMIPQADFTLYLFNLEEGAQIASFSRDIGNPMVFPLAEGGDASVSIGDGIDAYMQIIRIGICYSYDSDKAKKMEINGIEAEGYTVAYDNGIVEEYLYHHDGQEGYVILCAYDKADAALYGDMAKKLFVSRFEEE